MPKSKDLGALVLDEEEINNTETDLDLAPEDEEFDDLIINSELYKKVEQEKGEFKKAYEELLKAPENIVKSSELYKTLKSAYDELELKGKERDQKHKELLEEHRKLQEKYEHLQNEVLGKYPKQSKTPKITKIPKRKITIEDVIGLEIIDTKTGETVTGFFKPDVDYILKAKLKNIEVNPLARYAVVLGFRDHGPQKKVLYKNIPMIAEQYNNLRSDEFKTLKNSTLLFMNIVEYEANKEKLNSKVVK